MASVPFNESVSVKVLKYHEGTKLPLLVAFQISVADDELHDLRHLR